ncbi:MAG TPA: hypothetical protein VI479_16235 [Blastocatellia bacterium]
MVNQTFGSDQIIIRYLLNELSDDDQARFEEAYFSDGTLFEQVRALEEDLIDDYVKGGLSGDQRRRFESHYLASGQRRARIETARQVVELCSLNAPAQAAPSEQVEVWFSSLRRRLHFLGSWGLAPVWGAASAVLLLLATGGAVHLLRLRGQQAPVKEKLVSIERATGDLERQPPQQPQRTPEENKRNAGQNAGLPEQPGNRNSQVEQPRVPPQVSSDQFVFLALSLGVRSINSPDRAVISDNTRFVDLRIDLEVEDSAPPVSYRAVVKTVDGGREIWRQEGLKLQRRKAANYVVVRAPADRFKASAAQDFMLVISAVAAGRKGYEEVESHYFQVIANRN